MPRGAATVTWVPFKSDARFKALDGNNRSDEPRKYRSAELTIPLTLMQALRKASAASDAAMAQVRAQCQQRVSAVEEEMRGLLRAMERQKAKSAAKVQQLSAFVEELQRSS